MLSRFLTRLRTLLPLLFSQTRFDAQVSRFTKLSTLLADPRVEEVRNAVHKVLRDPSFHPTKDHHLKRREAAEWALTYLREKHGAYLPAWDLNFLLEWIVGEQKDRL